MEEDFDLIEASFLKQYGIRLRGNDLTWREFCVYLSGLMPDTPLGSIVAIRSEEDKDMLKSFTPSQLRIRSEWRRKMTAEMTDAEKENAMKGLEKMFEKAFGK